MITGSLVNTSGAKAGFGDDDFGQPFIFRSGNSIWRFTNYNNILTQSYQEIPNIYTLPNWTGLTSNLTGMLCTDIFNFQGSCLFTGMSGTALNKTTNIITFATANLPTSGLATFGKIQYQTLLSGTTTIVNFTWPYICYNSTDNSIWYVAWAMTSGDATNRRLECEVGRTTNFQVSGGQWSTVKLLSGAGLICSGNVLTTPQIASLPGGSAMVLLPGSILPGNILGQNGISSFVLDPNLNVAYVGNIFSGEGQIDANVQYMRNFSMISDENQNIHVSYEKDCKISHIYGSPYFFYQNYIGGAWSNALEVYNNTAVIPSGQCSTNTALTYDSGAQTLRMIFLLTNGVQSFYSGILFFASAGSPWTNWSIEGSFFLGSYYPNYSKGTLAIVSNIRVDTFHSGTIILGQEANATSNSTKDYVFIYTCPTGGAPPVLTAFYPFGWPYSNP